MAKEGTKQSSKKVASKHPEAVPMPRFRDYVRATLSVFWASIKRHKKLVIAIILILIALAGYYTWSNRPGRELTNDEIIIAASREADISGDGHPSLLRVVDKSQLKQPFLAEAEQGDVVLLYYKAKKAVIFRPGENRVVKVGEYTPPDAKIFIRQGGHNENKVEEAKQKIREITELEIVSQDYSTSQLNDKTVVIDLTDRYNEKAAEIAQKLGTEVVRLPKGETAPDADIMVLIGNN